MNLKAKYIFKTLIVAIIGYVIYFISDYILYGHKTNRYIWTHHKYLLNKNIIANVDTFLAVSDITENDELTMFRYVSNKKTGRIKFEFNEKDTAYNVVFWEFKKLAEVKVNQVEFRFNQNLDNLKLERGEILNSKSDQRISIHFGFEFENIQVNIDNHSKIQKLLSGKNYKGFLGSVNRISLSNEKNEHEIYIDYLPVQKQVIFLIYNSNKRFYIIMIDSDKYFDEKIMNILKLN